MSHRTRTSFTQALLAQPHNIHYVAMDHNMLVGIVVICILAPLVVATCCCCCYSGDHDIRDTTLPVDLERLGDRQPRYSRRLDPAGPQQAICPSVHLKTRLRAEQPSCRQALKPPSQQPYPRPLVEQNGSDGREGGGDPTATTIGPQDDRARQQADAAVATSATQDTAS